MICPRPASVHPSTERCCSSIALCPSPHVIRLLMCGIGLGLATRFACPQNSCVLPLTHSSLNTGPRLGSWSTLVPDWAGGVSWGTAEATGFKGAAADYRVIFTKKIISHQREETVPESLTGQGVHHNCPQRTWKVALHLPPPPTHHRIWSSRIMRTTRWKGGRQLWGTVPHVQQLKKQEDARVNTPRQLQ